MEFIGVSTAGSSIRGLFPLWAAELGLDGVTLSGTDLPLRSEPARYRETVARIAGDPEVRGALVTSHKVGVFDAAGDMFDHLDRYAQLGGEVSCVSKRGGSLVGHAKDPVTVAPALRSILDDEHFARTRGEVLCIGAGGAGMAITVHLLERADRPRRMVIADTQGERLDKLRAASAGISDHGVTVDTAHVGEQADADGLLAGLPPGSLVVNATGMGKDVPGSPLSDAATFPPGAIAWDLNYRGELAFLRQARGQADTGAGRHHAPLSIHDGWLYFLHGWAEHTAEVFDLDITPELFEQLRGIADAWRET